MQLLRENRKEYWRDTTWSEILTEMIYFWIKWGLFLFFVSYIIGSALARVAIDYLPEVCNVAK